MTEELLERFAADIRELRLIPSSGGRFEVLADGQVIFSKKQLGRHANPGEIVAALERRLAART